MTKATSKTMDDLSKLTASLKSMQAAQTARAKPDVRKPAYSPTPEQAVLSRAAVLFQQVVELNFETNQSDEYAQLLATVVAAAGDTLGSIEWAVEVIDALRDGEDVDEEHVMTLQALIIQAMNSELASLKSRKAPKADPARNHPARASSPRSPEQKQ